MPCINRLLTWISFFKRYLYSDDTKAYLEIQLKDPESGENVCSPKTAFSVFHEENSCVGFAFLKGKPYRSI